MKAFRPINCVCHSLSRLLVKEVGRIAPSIKASYFSGYIQLIRINLKDIVRSTDYRHNRLPHHSSLGAVFSYVFSVIFLGTPHRGSSQATIAKCFAKAAKALDANDNVL